MSRVSGEVLQQHIQCLVSAPDCPLSRHGVVHVNAITPKELNRGRGPKPRSRKDFQKRIVPLKAGISPTLLPGAAGGALALIGSAGIIPARSPDTIGALTITNTILGVPYYNYSIMGPKTIDE